MLFHIVFSDLILPTSCGSRWLFSQMGTKYFKILYDSSSADMKASDLIVEKTVPYHIKRITRKGGYAFLNTLIWANNSITKRWKADSHLGKNMVLFASISKFCFISFLIHLKSFQFSIYLNFCLDFLVK